MGVNLNFTLYNVKRCFIGKLLNVFANGSSLAITKAIEIHKKCSENEFK